MGVFRWMRDRVAHWRDPHRCDQVVELVTDYVEGAMRPDAANRFERHLRRCPDCVRYVEQVKLTIDTLGGTHPEPPSGETRAALLATFRDFRRE